MPQGALEGIRIADFTWAWAGPYATMLLAAMGAEVIKVESYARPDHTRVRSIAGGALSVGLNQAVVFNEMNLNKLSVTLDLSKPEAVELAKEIVRISDVVVENFRPGVMAKLGLGYDELKQVRPDVIMLSSSACGGTGPEREYVGYATTFGALSGLCHITGYRDGPPGPIMGAGDLGSATASAFAVLAALHHRYQTGEGQHIDLSSREVLACLIGDVLLDYTMNGRVAHRDANHNGVTAPHNVYRCQGEDKWVSIAIQTEDEWRGFREALSDPEWAREERFADAYSRRQNREELDRRIEAWTCTRTYYGVTETLQAHGVAAFPSMSSEDLYKDPHLRERDVYIQVEHPALGRRVVLGVPWKLSGTPARIERPAPMLGQHNDYVFGELLGMSREKIERLCAEGIIN